MSDHGNDPMNAFYVLVDQKKTKASNFKLTIVFVIICV